MKRVLFNRDCAGVAVSGLCMVHCVALPLLPALFPSVLPFLANLVPYAPPHLSGKLLSGIEFLFWFLAFLATSYSLAKLLRPHTCAPHHATSLTFGSLNQAKGYKNAALGLTATSWLWFLAVTVWAAPHLWTMATSLGLIVSHLLALVYSLKASQFLTPNEILDNETFKQTRSAPCP